MVLLLGLGLDLGVGLGISFLSLKELAKLFIRHALDVFESDELTSAFADAAQLSFREVGSHRLQTSRTLDESGETRLGSLFGGCFGSLQETPEAIDDDDENDASDDRHKTSYVG